MLSLIMSSTRRWGGLLGDTREDEARRDAENSNPYSVSAAEVGGDRVDVGEDPGEEVEEPDDVPRLVAQEQEALGAALDVVGGELREIDAGASAGEQVEEAVDVTIGADVMDGGRDTEPHTPLLACVNKL
jgi:hypothetical protein